jgi:hypothetical protein
MKTKSGFLVFIVAVALLQGCADTNPVQATIPTGPLTLEPAVGIYGSFRPFISSPTQLFVLTNPPTNRGVAAASWGRMKRRLFIPSPRM